MSTINIESLISPLSDESPSGDDLEYDLAFQELEEASKGSPDKVIRVKDPDNADAEIDRVIPGEEPDAKAMLDKAEALFARTRDLRVAVRMCYALTRVHGLPGMADGLALIAGLLGNLWDHVHPKLDPDDGNDPFFRINVLSALVETEGFFKVVRATPFVESRAVGRFTLRDIEVARGDLSPLEGQSTPSFELFQGALQESDADQKAARQSALESALEYLEQIRQVFRDHDAGNGPDLDLLKTSLKRTLEVMAADGAAAADGAGEEGTESFEGSSGQGGGAASGGGRLSTRADAKRQLQAVAEFLERSEPAHPAPIFVRRAISLLDMSFLEIVQNMAPDALSTVRHLGGIAEE